MRRPTRVRTGYRSFWGNSSITSLLLLLFHRGSGAFGVVAHRVCTSRFFSSLSTVLLWKEICGKNFSIFDVCVWLVALTLLMASVCRNVKRTFGVVGGCCRHVFRTFVADASRSVMMEVAWVNVYTCPGAEVACVNVRINRSRCKVTVEVARYEDEFFKRQFERHYCGGLAS